MTPTQACAAEVDLVVRIDAPSRPSSGYGLGVGTGVGVKNGTLDGWTIQFEHDPSEPGFRTRPVSLPDQAFQLGLAAPVTMSTATWHHVRLETRSDQTIVLLDGAPVPGSPFLVGQVCGSILLRVWGTTVTVKDISVRMQ